MRRNFSIFASYSLKFTCCLLFVVKSLDTHSKNCSLLVAEVARCKNSLITGCKSCSLQEITRCSLQILLVARYRSYSLPNMYYSSLVLHKTRELMFP